MTSSHGNTFAISGTCKGSTSTVMTVKIDQLFFYFIGRSTKPPLDFRHIWVITPTDLRDVITHPRPHTDAVLGIFY